ncbi:cytochrome P450 [Pseudonocardia asaccharolytica]|uniref:Cytochrome P450 n=1 Tax=Pseudonocardia asaccharolytica DSM 44247 = NBRC 16224 TaxID=1123024 RepID=A0A511D6K8_9PSEU|nr:cytochrome P450 [Pseudonocardia asaccharolytica]GEL20430.1 cytochrome P450 [Pseudonocardia asaccharolytica DSM 44247 = NBRC 16224]
MGLGSRVVAWFGRRYLARSRNHGFALSRLSYLPSATLMPLRRIGLDPVPELGRKRRAEPISKLKVPIGLNTWLVTGHEETKAVLGRTEGFSNDFDHLVGNTGVTAEQNPGGLGFSDPPVHTRLRRLLTPEFTRRRLARLAPRIDAIVADQLDAMEAARQPVDLWQAFALPIPSLTICELLGIPYADRADFQRLSTARFDLVDSADSPLSAISESLDYLRTVIEKKRGAPDDGLLGMLIKEHGDEIDDEELTGLADGLLTGGFETTASMLALGALMLLQNPEAAELLRRDDDATTPFVEEALRYLTVVQVAFPRFATQDMEIAGVQISRGDVVLCSLSGANRDDALGAGMESFDPSRRPTSHLAFGHGIHRCVGAELARMELCTAFPALVRRFPAMRLAVPPEKLAFRKTSIVYGLEALPVLLR